MRDWHIDAIVNCSLSYAQVEKQVAERTRELGMASRELLQSQKMRALGTLAAGIAHDFNNILSIIKGSAQLIEDNPGNTEKIRTRTDRIKTMVDQGSAVVQAMLGFSRERRRHFGTFRAESNGGEYHQTAGRPVLARGRNSV